MRIAVKLLKYRKFITSHYQNRPERRQPYGRLIEGAKLLFNGNKAFDESASKV